MLIEIHIIQNHSPANMNRDDLGAPKTCLFGGVTRARISSQCLKRSIRRSAQFQEALERDGGVRTRSLVREIARRASGRAEPPEDQLKKIARVFKDGGVGINPTAGDGAATDILFFIPDSAIDRMAEASKESVANLGKRFADILGAAGRAPDIALSGRMTEFAAAGAFKELKFGVEAALQAAHAISTHAVVNEVDYWTAVDDLGEAGGGSGHLGEAMFNSACFYEYFSLDWEQLVANLGGDDDARNLAACTVGHFIRAAARTAPSGKQNSYASHTDPCGILVEIKKKQKLPTNYANAFAEPVERIGKPPDDAADVSSIEGRSVACLAEHVQSIRRAYGTESALLWYSPKLWRFPFMYRVRAEDGKPTNESRFVTDKRYDVLGGESGESAGLVEAAMAEIGFDWGIVRDAGRAPSAGSAQ